MNDMVHPGKLAVGSELIGPERVLTVERIEWYDSAMLSAAKGELAQVGDNIHTDDDFAQNQGLPAAIADGMTSTNYCSSMLVAYFGMDYIERGELRTKFIKPIFLGSTIIVRGKVLEINRLEGGKQEYKLDVWCEIDDGTKVVDGDARIVTDG